MIVTPKICFNMSAQTIFYFIFPDLTIFDCNFLIATIFHIKIIKFIMFSKNLIKIGFKPIKQYCFANFTKKYLRMTFGS